MRECGPGDMRCNNKIRGKEMSAVIAVAVSSINLVREGVMAHRLPTEHDVYSRGIKFYILNLGL